MKLVTILKQVMARHELLNGNLPILFVRHVGEFEDDITIKQDFEDYRQYTTRKGLVRVVILVVETDTFAILILIANAAKQIPGLSTNIRCARPRAPSYISIITRSSRILSLIK